jgi:hypothetical protein
LRQNDLPLAERSARGSARPRAASSDRHNECDPFLVAPVSDVADRRFRPGDGSECRVGRRGDGRLHSIRRSRPGLPCSRLSLEQGSLLAGAWIAPELIHGRRRHRSRPEPSHSLSTESISNLSRRIGFRGPLRAEKRAPSTNTAPGHRAPPMKAHRRVGSCPSRRDAYPAQGQATTRERLRSDRVLRLD